jgi:hypothetical protein
VSSLYTPFLVLHVLVAILGLGSISSVGIVAATARRTGRGPAEVLPLLALLLRYSAFSLGTMLVTGILMDLAARGAFRASWWFRGSALLLIATGALYGQARRTVRRGFAKHVEPSTILRRVERISYAMASLIAAITVLMEVKPY